MILRLGLILMILAGACWVAFGLIGSEIDENGILQEPFYLLGGGWLLMLAGTGLVLIALITRLFRRR
ncbi:DUF3955 domain-containing protein [Fluviibacterium sp. DFM31]|uniref:DUF3955 domain-containing protein n=1 Tax=Meridianimarinicoccus marinus TaxID=3231483 RepID=A0ABV3L2S9_9RHOB